jgi:lipoprotein signal peptidase
MSSGGRKILLLNTTALIFFILDRFIKNIYFFGQNLSWLKFQENPNFLYFFQGDFFYWLIIIIFIGLIYLIAKNYQRQKYLTVFPLTLIFIGGFSNFWDRLLYGFVIDYFNFFNIWTFNLADLMILTGSLIFLGRLLKSKKGD